MKFICTAVVDESEELQIKIQSLNETLPYSQRRSSHLPFPALVPSETSSTKKSTKAKQENAKLALVQNTMDKKIHVTGNIMID